MAAVLGIAGFIDAPIVHYAVTWWGSNHTDTDYFTNSALPTAVTIALLLSFAAFTLLYVLLTVQVYRSLNLRRAALKLRAQVEDVASRG
jgi:hypothetical protein